MNVAIISPSQKIYSETFIEAHKQIKANVYYYYGGGIPNHLEGSGVIEAKAGTMNRWTRKIYRRIIQETLSVQEVEFIKSLKKNKIDVVFAEYGVTGAEIVNACQRIELPLVTIFHGYDAFLKQLIDSYRLKYQNLFRYSSKIIVVSEVMKQQLIELGCPEEKICKAICAPNDLFLGILPSFKEHKSFVAVGRFVDKKAPYYTLLAIRKAAEKHPDIKLYFAGQGALFETVHNLIGYFNLKNNVKLLDVITTDEFIALLSVVTGFVQHSITSINGDMEGTPVTVQEASAAGIPVISTRHAGIPEVIIDGKTGFLVDEHDVDAMASCIVELIENPKLAMEMGRNGKENIRLNFSMGKHLRIIESALQEAILLNTKRH
ncbi:MAG TPA: glycosyltransferase [Bacteroidales bacterium]|nr:glycosyltransferase [Bacteroidales bacterium]